MSHNIVMSRWPLLWAWWFLEVFSPNNLLYPLNFFLKQRLINASDDDDDDIVKSLNANFVAEHNQQIDFIEQKRKKHSLLANTVFNDNQF